MAAAVWPASACEATKFGGNGLTVQYFALRKRVALELEL